MKVVGGDALDATSNAICHRINAKLGAIGKSVIYTEEPAASDDNLQSLTSKMEAGKINTLLMLGGNPIYNAPADIQFAASLA